jgi:hypothetical protein
MLKRIFAYYIPLTLLICIFFTNNRTIILNDGSTVINFYGFPYGYISSAYACTRCYEVFLVPLCITLLIIFASISLLSLIVRKFIKKYYAHRWGILFGLLITLACIVVFIVNTTDATFHFRPYTDYEVLKSQLNFGIYP